MQGSTADFEVALGRLLAAYSEALAFAGDLPRLGRCRVRYLVRSSFADVDQPLPTQDPRVVEARRWIARAPARMWLEIHVRGQLRHLARCLDDDLLAVLPPGDERLSSLRDHVDQQGRTLRGWQFVRELVVRLPPVAAALPVVAAVTTRPFSAVDRAALLPALVAVGVTAAVLYALVVWPSMRLGYRVMRAILSGGVDLLQPFLSAPGRIEWLEVVPPAAPRRTSIVTRAVVASADGVEGWWRAVVTRLARLRRDSAAADAESARGRGGSSAGSTTTVDAVPTVAVAEGVQFPRVAVYREERATFTALGRSPQSEAPLPILLSPVLYLLVVLSSVMLISEVRYLLGPSPQASTALGFGVMAVGAGVVTLVVLDRAWRNHRAHLRRWGSAPAASRP